MHIGMPNAFLFLVLLTTLAPLCECQVATDVFLRGEFIEVGIHKVASYGTSTGTPIPSGFYAQGQASRWNNGLGFIADFDGNGWTGTRGFSGDYFLPGSPLEGWSVEYQNSATGGENVYINKGKRARGCVSEEDSCAFFLVLTSFLC